MAIQTCSLFHRAVNKGERRIPPLSTLCFKAVNLSFSLHLSFCVLSFINCSLYLFLLGHLLESFVASELPRSQ